MPMINEAIFCVMEGVATPESIDTVMKLGMAHPMGPLALADFIGLDVCLAILEVLQQGPGRRQVPRLLRCCARWWRRGTWAGRAGRGSMTTSKSVSGKRSAVSGTAAGSQSSVPAHRSPLTAHASGPSLDIFAAMRLLGPRAAAALPRSLLRLLRHHRDPRHHPGPGARRHPVLAVRAAPTRRSPTRCGWRAG